MKKVIFSTMCLLLGTLMLQAQDNKYVGVQLGFSQPITRLNAPVQGKETSLNANIYNGLKIGLVYDETIVKGFGYTIGLNYTFGGKHTDWTSKNTHSVYPKVRSRGQYHQMEVVVDWQYKFQIAKDTWVMLYTGPSLQCGFNLQDKWYVKFDNNAEQLDYTKNYYSTESAGNYALKRINVTWGIGAGFQFDRYFLRGGYDFGIINPYKEEIFKITDQYKPYTRGRFDQWQIKAGMYLWHF